MDARRAADRLGIPFYVWDFSERFRDDVIEDFVAEYSAGRTPNPCMRCNERIKFAAVLEKALDLGFDAVCTGHYAIVRTGRVGRPRAAPGERQRQGPVLRARRADRRAARAHALPARRDALEGARARRGRGPRAHRRAQARQPRHLLHPRRRHPRLARRPRRRGDGRHRRPRRARSSAPTRARTRSRSASAAASPSACRRPTASRASCSRCGRSRTPSSSARRRRWPPPRSPGSGSPGPDARPTATDFACHVQIRAHADPVPARAVLADGMITRASRAAARRRRARADRRALRRHAGARPVHDRPHRSRRFRSRSDPPVVGTGS